MLRRNFLKGLGSLLTLSYVNPVALIPEVSKMQGGVITGSWETSCYHLSDFEAEFIFPAVQKLANAIDTHIIEKIIKGEFNDVTHRRYFENIG